MIDDGLINNRSWRRHDRRSIRGRGSVGGFKRDGGEFFIWSRACWTEEDAGRDASGWSRCSGSWSNTRDGWKSSMEAGDCTVEEAGGCAIVGVDGMRSGGRKKLREEVACVQESLGIWVRNGNSGRP